MSPPPPSDTLIVGRYQLTSMIGAGCRSQVWLARDIRDDGQAVAVKLSRPGQAPRPGLVAEAELMAHLEHPHIVRILETGRDPELGEFYVMEYFPDGSLADILLIPNCPIATSVPGLAGQRYVPLVKILEILRPIAQALDFVHRQHPDVLHRNLHPGNILVDLERGRYVLSDFSLTTGAPPTMSPEQLIEFKDPPGRRRPVDWRSDLYSFGACLYKLATGSYPVPVSNANLMEAVDRLYHFHLVEQVAVDKPRRRNPANPDLENDAVNTIIHRVTNQRRSIRTLNGDITRIEDVLDLLARAIGQKKERLTPIFAITAALAAVLLLAGSVMLGSLADSRSPLLTPLSDQVEQLITFSAPEAPAGSAATRTPGTVAGSMVLAARPASTTSGPAGTAQGGTGTQPAEQATLQCDDGLMLLDPENELVVSDESLLPGIIEPGNMQYYKVEYQPPGSHRWLCCLVGPTSQPISPAELGHWDRLAARFGAGEYGVRLVAVRDDGTVNVCETRVTVE